MEVRSIMSLEPDTISPDVSFRELERRLLSQGVGGFPVVDGDKLVGIVTRSDLVRILELEHAIDDQIGDREIVANEESRDEARNRGARIGARLELLRVSDLMVHNVQSIEPGATVRTCAQMMRELGVHRLPVVEGDRLVGIVTSLDLVGLVERVEEMESWQTNDG